SSTLSWGALVQRFAGDEFGRYADTIVRNRLWALLHGCLMVFAASAGIFIMTLLRGRHPSILRVIPWVLVGLVLADVFFLSRHYVKTMPISELAENDVIRLLKSDMPERRVAVTTQDGFYNFWLTYMFPYYGIKTTNATQTPRIPADYEQFLRALGGNSIRLWQLCATGYVLGPSGVWGQISQKPDLKEWFNLVLAYNVISSDGATTVLPGTPSQPGQQCVLRFKKTSPPFVLLAKWQVVDDAEALRLLASNDFPLFSSALVSADSAEGLPEPTGEGMVGSVQRVQYRPGLIRLRASTHVPAVLRIAEKYDKGWKVTVNGQPATLRRVDYLFQGVCVDPGVNEVVFRYAPDNRSLIPQALGIVICGVALVCLIREKIRGRAAKSINRIPE
ncbi:YfhO family protein, partial [Verrucomicrobiota bacterium]